MSDAVPETGPGSDAPQIIERMTPEDIARIHATCRASRQNFSDTLIRHFGIHPDTQSKVRSIICSIAEGNQVPLDSDWAMHDQGNVQYAGQIIGALLYVSQPAIANKASSPSASE